MIQIVNGCIYGKVVLTLRSTLERICKTEANSESLRIVLHLPGPYLAIPALSAASSSDVHFCLGTPICAVLKTYLQQIPMKKIKFTKNYLMLSQQTTSDRAYIQSQCLKEMIICDRRGNGQF